MTTKAERQQEWKNRHLKALAELGFTGSYRTLRTLENRANWNALQYCNGDIDGDQYEERQERIKASVTRLFDGKLPAGFFVNGDPRGYALKIDMDNLEYGFRMSLAGLHKDWGGYGILAPEEF